MPTSVLLAVLVATGVFALAPALVRRYDAAERLTAERLSSTVRVLTRPRHRRSVPGRTPINPPRWLVTPASDRRDRPHPAATPTVVASDIAKWQRTRRRRVLAVLTILVVTEAAGVLVVGPGFWVGLILSMLLLASYVAALRARVRAEQRQRRAAAARATTRSAALRHQAKPLAYDPVIRTDVRPVPPPAASRETPTVPSDEADPPPRAANM